MSKKLNHIGGLEELILLAVQNHQKNDAYGASIHRVLEEAGRKLSIGSLYITLARLEEKGFLSSKFGESTPARGGRSKKYFELTGRGAEVLETSEAGRQAIRRLSLIPGGLK